LLPCAMRLSLLLLLGCLAAIASAGCIHTGTSLMLDEDDFEDKVVKSDALITFVEFSSPWCIWAIPNSNGHGDCATMRKDWDRLADTYRARDLVEIAEVDCSRWVHHPAGEDGTYKTKESLCQRFSIRSYPTVYVFDGASGANGTLYEGGMSYDEMHTFLESEHAKLCEISADETHVPDSKCDEHEIAFLDEWRGKDPVEADKELHRLEKLAAQRNGMQLTAIKRSWMGKRMNLLKQLRRVRRPKAEPKVEL